MLMTSDTVMGELKSYESPKSKLTRLIQEKKIFHVCHGVYATDLDEPRLPVASMIMEQSYISFETALFYHGLVPEAPEEILSAGYLLKHNKHVSTLFGSYAFLYIPEKAFALARSTGEEGGYKFPLATPEKALCDMLYRHSPMQVVSEMGSLLEVRLRIPKEKLHGLDWDLIPMLATHYHNRNCSLLLAWREQSRRTRQGWVWSLAQHEWIPLPP